VAKGRVYYRCQRPGCPTNSIREDRLAEPIEEALERIALDAGELARLQALIPEQRVANANVRSAQITSLRHLIQFTESRLVRLTDLYVLRGMAREDYDIYRARQIANRDRLREVLQEVEVDAPDHTTTPQLPVQILGTPAAVYSLASPDLKRELVTLFTEKRSVNAGEATAEVKADALREESAARWYVRIVMQAWNAQDVFPTARYREDRVEPTNLRSVDIAHRLHNHSAIFAHINKSLGRISVPASCNGIRRFYPLE
jgi:hypothetical protein